LPFAPFRLLFRLRAALGLACSRFADAALDDALSPLLQFRFRAALDLAPSSFADAALDDSECSTSSRLRSALNLAPLDPLFFAAAVDDRVRTPPIVNATSERNTKGGNIDAVQHNYGRIIRSRTSHPVTRPQAEGGNGVMLVVLVHIPVQATERTWYYVLEGVARGSAVRV
jgi:hypothetical protein